MNPAHPVLRSACLGLLLAAALPATTSVAQPIDRQAVVSRHAVHVTRVDPEATLSIGNGDFAFGADVTGLQTFETLYYTEGIPLETLSTWAWHSNPNPEGLRLEDAMAPTPFHGRMVPYASLQDSPAGAYFRENPHPMPLGQLSLIHRGQPVAPEDLTEIDQRLDMWTGIIHSRYRLHGQPVTVETVAHPKLSQVAVNIRSPLIASGDLQVRLRFAYAHQVEIKNKPPLIWDRPDAHRTEVVRRSANSTRLSRTIDDTHYAVELQWEGRAALTEAAPHDFRLASGAGDTLTFTTGFAETDATTAFPTFAATRAASIEGWRHHWTKGGIVDLAGSTDPRAHELEQRIIRSLYLVKVHYSGDFPPSETGLAHLTWYGKHNSEVYFWHAAQFYQWGHTDLLEKGLSWYQKILERGIADAKSKGFDGVRWPKMAGIDGRPGPGTINPFIIWNQPNPIYLSELVYRAKPERATLEKYRDMVFESAKFLASFAHYDEATRRYVIGPPIKNVSERSGENNTQNPTFELAFWHYGLQLAQTWRERLGMAREPLWDDILAKLSPLPVADGKYLEIETFPDIYAGGGGLPTSMILALGYLPKTPMVDIETMRRTFHEINNRSRNGLSRWVSWSIGQGALTAARLNEPETAVGIATNPGCIFMPSGFVRRPAEPDGCPAYLPVNGALLAAAGVMIAGWDTAPEGNAPGFPRDGTWSVKWEGLNRMP